MKKAAAFTGLCILAAAVQELQPRRLPPPNGSLHEEFVNVHSLRELSDGRVLVTERGVQRLLVADFRAGTVQVISRRGGGPGEYERLFPFPTRAFQ